MSMLGIANVGLARTNLAIGLGVTTSIPTLNITAPTSFPDHFTIGTAITSIQFACVNPVGTTTWTIATVTVDQLPGGLTLDPSGLLHGTPAPGSTGSYSVTFQVTDSLGRFDLVSFSFNVVAVGALVITNPADSTTVLSLTKGQAMTPFVFTSTGGTGTKTWTCTTGIPAGLTIDASGNLHGTPTGTGNSVETFRVTDSATPTPNHVDVDVTINRAAPPSVGTWPEATIQGEWGISFRGPVSMMQSFYDGLTTTQKNGFNWIRLQASWYTIEPQADGVYTFGSVDGRVSWCQDPAGDGSMPAIGVCFLVGYTPWKYTIKPQYTIDHTIVQGGENRIYFTSIDDGQWQSIHVKSSNGNVQNGSAVVSNGMQNDANGTYLSVDKAVTAGNGGIATFGGQAGFVSEPDRHLWPDPAHYDDLARAVVALLSNYPNVKKMLEYYNEVNGGYSQPGILVNGVWDGSTRTSLTGPQAYANAMRYIYRAVKEYDPSIPVATCTADKSITGTRQYRPSDWHLSMWRHMKNPTDIWKTWLTDTTHTFLSTDGKVNGKLVSNHTMAELFAAGAIDYDFWVDFGGLHLYEWGHNSDSLFADNYIHMHRSNVASGTPAHVNEILNDQCVEDPVTLTFTGTVTGGTLVLGINVYSFPGGDNKSPDQTAGTVVNTAAINWNDSDATIASKIQAKSGGVVTVISFGNRRRIYFGGTLAGNVAGTTKSKFVDVTKVTNSLTGTTPDFTVARVGINKLKWISTEIGPPLHPLAVTGRGYTGTIASSNDMGGHALPGRNTDSVTSASKPVASAEESYINVKSLKKLLNKSIAWPTGGGMPSLLPPVGDVRDHFAYWNFQSLTEVSSTSAGGYAPYSDAVESFSWQGMYLDNASGDGGEHFNVGDLKRALVPDRAGGSRVPAGESRPHLNGNNGFPDNVWGSGSDAYQAF
jgi:hypothetical protein